MTQFSELGLAASIVKTLDGLGYSTPTPIQRQAIPLLLEGKDLLGIAQTGTGKTAAFALPLLHHLNASQKDGQRPAKSVRGLGLAPTRELAIQISDSFREYGHSLGLKTVVVLGGVPIAKQIRALQNGTDVLIATPGRLEDLMQQKAVTLDHVSHLVLDEADQMLDMGFIHVLKRIAAVLPKNRQTLLFSATMPKEIEALSKQFQNAPEKVSVAPVSSTAEKVSQAAYFVKQQDKPVLLSKLLKDRAVSRAIVFTRTKHGANRLVKQLDKANLDALAIHGNKNQNQRQKALNAFRDGECVILVATDVAARGIDIPEVSHVFNFDLPDVAEQYVHRIGRTARAGKSGEAVSLISNPEKGLLRAIEKLTGVELEVFPLPAGFQQDVDEAPEELTNLSPRDRRKSEFRGQGGGGRQGGRGQGRRGRSSGGRASGGRGQGQGGQNRSGEGRSEGGRRQGGSKAQNNGGQQPGRNEQRQGNGGSQRSQQRRGGPNRRSGAPSGRNRQRQDA